MNLFRQGIDQSRVVSTIGLSLTSASLIGASVLMPVATPEFRVFVGGVGVATGAIASIAQREQKSWQETASHLELSANALLISSCVSLVCAAAIPNKPEQRSLNLLTIGSGVIAIACAKKAAIASASIAGLVEEEVAIGFGKEFDLVAKPQKPQQLQAKPISQQQLPPSQPKPLAQPTAPAQQQIAHQPPLEEQAIATMENEVAESVQVEIVEQQPQAIEDTRIELIASELLSALSSFGFNKVRWIGAAIGPNFIRCLIDPGAGVGINSLQKIAQNLGRVLHLENPLFPEHPVIPTIGQQPGVVTIDIPRADRQVVYFSQYFPSEPNPTNPSGLKLAIGVNIRGELIYVDLSNSNTPHILMGGVTGSGKSEALRFMLASGIWSYSPEVLQIIIIDVKRVTFPEFENTPHVKQVVKSISESISTLENAVREMDDRYKLFEDAGAKNIDDYRQKTGKVIPRIIIAIDEFADFMSDTAVKPKLEDSIKRLGALARASGIHLIAGTQRPDAKTVTPLIRSNLPAILGLKVGRDKDSAIVFGLDGYKDLYYLLGHGDLIYNQGFQRLQAPFFDLTEQLENLKVAKPCEENLLDRYFANKVEFVASERDRFEKFRLSLPTHPGVYCVSDGAKVYYVGQSENVARRWMRSDYKHHWLPAILELLNQGKKVFIYSKIIRANLEQAERDLIEQLKPEWNGKDPIREVREMRQKNQQIILPQSQVTEEERQQVLDCKERGLNQDDTIYEIWKVRKSGSDSKYLTCREKYRSVVNATT